MKMNSFICTQCGKPTLHVKDATNHVLHLLLTLVTLGSWLIVWVLVSIFGSHPWRCNQCGMKVAGSGWGVAGDIYREVDQVRLRRELSAERQKELDSNLQSKIGQGNTPLEVTMYLLIVAVIGWLMFAGNYEGGEHETVNDLHAQ